MSGDPEPTLDEPDTDIEVIHKLRARIEALEAALREIADCPYNSFSPWKIARAALNCPNTDAPMPWIDAEEGDMS